MKKRFQKTAAIVLAVSMAVSLAACGKQAGETGNAGVPQTRKIPEVLTHRRHQVPAVWR